MKQFGGLSTTEDEDIPACDDNTKVQNARILAISAR